MAGRESTSTLTRSRCTGSDVAARGAISLPVVDTDHNPGGTIRKSKNGRRRAIVLAVVQGVLIVHIVIWLLSREFGWFGGATVTPVEPSESMEFVKNGIINAGLIFFVLALLSTFVLGRWFCGWGCHVLLLQDACGWMMKKVGIRPKPFRSRLLIYVPLLLALYMFVWPAAYRWGLVPLDAWMGESLGAEHGLVEGMRTTFGLVGVQLPAGGVAPWRTEWHITTREFWRTFPGLLVAVPFLLVCGFATVYLMGSKAFCTYGCPYGGFFRPLDRFAVGSIRVTDACEECGHCTAVCTSNVRVHEEVREYGMVVDPGCMKCTDCVSVCPNDALYFGFGKPALFKGKAKNEKPAVKYDMSWGEELAIAGVFALSFFAIRGVYEVVPFLMAAGAAGVVTFLVWKLWRMVRDEHVSLHRFRLKYRGSVQRAGWVFAGITVLVMALTAHSGVVNLAHAVGNRSDEQVHWPAQRVFTDHRTEMPAAMQAHARRAIRALTLASSLEHGGIGLLPTWQSKIDIRLAWLHSALGEFGAAEACVERMIERDELSEATASSLFRILFAGGERERAMAHVVRMAEDHPEFLGMLAEGASWLIHEGEHELALEVTETAAERRPASLAGQRLHAWTKVLTGDVDGGVADAMQTTLRPGQREKEARPHQPAPHAEQFLDNIVVELVNQQRIGEAIELSRAGIAQFPESLQTMRRLSILEMQFGELDKGIALIRRTLELDPHSVAAHYYLALALAMDEQFEEAYHAMKTAIEMSHDAPGPWYMQMAEICAALGKGEEAQRYAAEGQKRLQ